MKYYKFLHEKYGKIVSSQNNFEWEIGKEYSVEGKINNCNRLGPTNGLHASKQPLDALNHVKGSIVAIVEASGDSDNDTDKICVRSMKIVKAYRWTTDDSIRLAIYSAKQIIKIYEDKHPDDSRLLDAIEAARAYLKSPSKKTANAAAHAANAAYAAHAARAAAHPANAAHAAYAAYAAYAAKAADYVEIKAKINRYMKVQIKKLEEIK